MLILRPRNHTDKFNIFGKWTTEPTRNSNKLETFIGGALPFYKNISYSLSAETDNGDDIRPCFMPETYYVHDPSTDYLWVDTLQYSYAVWDTTDTVGLDDWVGDWADSTDGDWQAEKAQRIADGWIRGWKDSEDDYLPHSDYNKYRLLGKVNYKIEPIDAKISLLGIATRDQNAEYSAAWKYNLDGYYSSLQKSYLLGATWAHNITNKINYTLKFSKHHSQTQTGVRDTVAEKDRSWWEDYTFLSDEDADGDGMFDAYEGNASNTYTVDNPYGVAGIFYTFGLARIWEKTFFDRNIQKLDINSDYFKNHDISAGVELNQYHIYKKYNSLPWDPVPFKDYYDLKPIQTRAFYIQDKMIVDDKLFIRAGFRLDYAKYENSDYSYTINIRTKKEISPSLGAGYLATPSTKIFINYDQFKQLPGWQRLSDADWYTPVDLDTALNLFEKTDLYEAGLLQQIFNVSFNAKYYYKSMNNFLQPALIIDPMAGLSWLSCVYADYGTAQGFELGLKYNVNYFYSEFNYSYSKAIYDFKDTNDNNIIMDYDQTGKFNFITNFFFGDNFGPKVGGFHPLANLTVGLTNNFGTGFPYTATDIKGKIKGAVNGSSLPNYWYTNLLISKKLNFKNVGFSLDLEILNLFDRKNISSVYSTTGLVDNDSTYFYLEQFTVTGSIPDSISYTVDADGNPVMVPNPYYSKWRDLNSDGTITPEEKYITYVTAYNDLISDPFNLTRVPYDRAYLAPRRLKLSLSVSF